MMQSGLAQLLDEAAPELIARVEATLAATTAALPLRRTIERLPGLMRELVARLRAGALDAAGPTAQPIDVVPFVTALALLKQSIYALIDERQAAVAPRDVRIIGDWFAVAETALTVENRRFVDMLDAIPDQLMLHNTDAQLVYVNAAAAEMGRWAAGLEPEETLGRRVGDFVRDKDFGRTVDENARRVVAGERVREELLLPHPDGARWSEHHVRPLLGADGRIAAVATASRDIHARKKAEARLQLLAKLGVLAESMEHEGIIDAIAHLSIPELADWCLINVIEDRDLPRTTLAHRDPARAALALELLALPSELQRFGVGQAALAGRATLIVDVATATAHAELRHSEIAQRLRVLSAIVVPIVVMRSTVAIVTFMMTPESGRRYGDDDLALAQEMALRAAQIIENARLHQQVRQSEARFRLALEHTNISVFETDLALRFRWVYNSQLDSPDSQLVGTTMSESFGAARAELDQLARRIIDTGAGSDLAFTRVSDGRERHLMVRCEPLRGLGGIVGLVGATIDVTDLKEAEEQLARELGFRERMMGVLGHDLRNPVSAVLGTAGLLRLEAGLLEQTREGLALIEQSARRMNEMIGTLLDFTRLRFHGSLPVAIKEVVLDERLRLVVAELQAAHRGREISLVASGDLRGSWDPARLAQLLSNLVANALAHGARKSPVAVTLTGTADVVLLSVSNRGPTIAPALVERLFEPFQQGAASSEGRTRGLGLGLFIVREIARAHSGTIDVRSDDELTTFTVRLPRQPAPPASPY